MKIKEEMIEEFKKYLKEFDNYDKKLEDIEKKENEHKEKVEKFNEKWGEYIFPPDKPIKEKEEEDLKEEEKNIKDEKEMTTKELEAKVKELITTKINEWIQKIEDRRVELEEADNDKNKDKIKEQKIRLEKELQEQEEGIKIWEKEGINPEDVLYKRRKEVLIPNLKSQIKDCELKLDGAAIREEDKKLWELKEKLKPMPKWSRETVTKNLKELFELDKTELAKDPTPEPTKNPTPEPAKTPTPEPAKTPTPEPAKTPTPEPTKNPTPEPAKTPTPEPTKTPTPEPAKDPTPEPTKTPTPEPAKTPTPEPTKTPTPEPAKDPTPEPTKNPTPEPAKTPTPEPAKTPTPEPAKTPTPEPTKNPTPEPAKKPTSTQTQALGAKGKVLPNTDKIIIGREIKLKDKNGVLYSIGDTKGYFKKYEKRGRIGTIARAIKKFARHPIEYVSDKKYREIPDIYADLAEKLNVETIDEDLLKSINLNPVLAYAFEEGLKIGNLHSKDVLNAIYAVSSNDKEALGVAFPIEWNKTDMSKGTFLPWVRRDRNKLAEFADESADLMEVTGEYQPSFAKKVFGKLFTTEEETKLLTEGEEEKKKEENKKEENKEEEKKNPAKEFREEMKREAQPKQSDNKIEELLEEQREKMAEEVKKAVQDKGAER